MLERTDPHYREALEHALIEQIEAVLAERGPRRARAHRILALVRGAQGAQRGQGVREAHAKLKAEGKLTSREPAYGFHLTSGGKVVPYAREQEAIAEVVALRGKGLSFARIAGEMNRSKHRPRGAKWHPTTIANIVKHASEST